MIPFIPMIVVGLTAAGVYVAKNRAESKMTPERTIVYNHALANLKDPEKLRTLSAAFEGEGLTEQADMLLKRASLRELPKDVKDSRRYIYRQGMASLNPDEVIALADSFEKEGCTGACAALRARAVGLKEMLKKQ